MNEEWLVVYLDDISILSKTATEHKERLRQVFEVLQQNNMRRRLDKCIWGVPKTKGL